MKKKVWFEKCDCGAHGGGPHGYFHAIGKGKCPIPMFSMEAGESMLTAISTEIELSEAEKEKVRGQFRAAGLAEKLTDADSEMASLFAFQAMLASVL